VKQNSTVYNTINILLLVESKDVLDKIPVFEKVTKKRVKSKKIDVSILEMNELNNKTQYPTSSLTTDDAMDELLDGLPHNISKMSKQWANGLKLAKKVSYLFAKNDIGIVHAHGYSLWLAGLFLKWSYRMPLIFSDYVNEINSSNYSKFSFLDYLKDNGDTGPMSKEIGEYCMMFADRVLLFSNHKNPVKTLYNDMNKNNPNNVLLDDDIVDILSFYKMMVKDYENTDAFMGIST
jgi:hypothetical protein